ncbi:Fic family protein [Pedobacter sp. UYP30]|uniref:Fic family protein n=1 Tax=Pedobacter sp. UYP30 TaxID=1756400 RepID=UPI0033921BAB
MSTDLLSEYLLAVAKNLQCAFDQLYEAELSTPKFSFYTSVAAVFSSKIEGEKIELDSYIKHKRDGIPFLPDYTKKIDDLYYAYIFAQQSELNENNVKEAHKLLSKHLVSATWQGKYRSQNMYVASEDGKIDYVAARPQIVATEMNAFFEDIRLLVGVRLSIEEIFFYAAMIHLVFVKIHPWSDGNGRCARLIEKWFIAEKIGEKAWFIQCEKMYYLHHQAYYKNLKRLGIEYQELNFNNGLPFLLMLPQSLINK